MHYDQDVVKCMTPAEYLLRYPENQLSAPAGSSWGGDGTYDFWINDVNQDIIPGLHQAADRLSDLVEKRPGAGDFGESREEAALRQMMRELMLAQASDWPFIMRTGTSPEYAHKRVRDHLARFWTLDAMLQPDGWNEKIYQAISQADNLFPDCDPGLYRR
jgi:1,4-alpha-glucan branching enzyme